MTSGDKKDGAILSVGRIYCDLIFTGLPRMPTPGTEIYGEGLRLCAGGGAGITAAYLAKLGWQTCLSGILPAAPFGDIALEDIRQAGIDPSWLSAAADGQDPQLTVSLVGAADRAFITRRSGAAIPEFRSSALVERGIRHVHIGELATLAEAPWLIDVARKAGATISLDCGWDETLQGAIEDLIAGVDVFLPNEAECEWLTRRGVGLTSGPLVVEKRGPNGAAVIHPGHGPCAAVEPLTAIDPTGAGDAFNAGFLDQWLQGSDLASCLKAGNRSGASAIASVGGFDKSA